LKFNIFHFQSGRRLYNENEGVFVGKREGEEGLMKRLFMVLLGLCLILCGCGQPQAGEEEKEEVSLTFMMPQSHAKDFLLELIAEFEEENPGIRLEIQRIPDDQWIDLVHSKAAVGEMPDIIRLDKWVLEAVGTSHFVEFGEDTSWYGRVLPSQLENKLIDGKLYGLPVASTSGLGLIYNKEIFDDLGLEVPKDMEELYQVCERIRQAGLIPMYASDKEAWTIQVAFNCMVMQYTDDDMWQELKSNRLKWSDVEEYHRILEYMQSLRRQGYTNEDYMEATYNSAVEAVAEGKAAMYVMGQFFINDVLKRNPECELMMAPFPYNGSDLLSVISGAGVFAVCAKSRYIEEAKTFLEWFSQPEHMNRFNSGWNHPPVFKEQDLHMSSWQQYIYDQYIAQGRTVVQIDETLSGINLNSLWNNLKEMLAGRMAAGEVLKAWDEDFGEQMKYKQESGW